MLDGPFGNILIIKPSAMGDIVCALPVPAAIKRRWPQAKVSWLVASHLEQMVTDHPDIDQVISFDRKKYRHIVRSWPVGRRFLKFLGQLRRNNFDLVIDLQGLFRSGFLAWCTGAAVRIGPHEKREMGWIFYTHRLERCDKQTHAVDRICTLGQLLPIDLDTPTFKLPITNAAQQSAGNLLDPISVPEGQPFAVLAVGGTWQSKRWGIERFSQVADQLISKYGLAVVLVGQRCEKPLAEQLTSQSRRPIANLVTKTSLKELMALLVRASVVVTNDSGPMHIAAALGRPTVAIFGPTNPQRTGPYGQLDHVLQSKLPCLPCYKRRCAELTCMNDITTDQVMAMIAKVLQPVG